MKLNELESPDTLWVVFYTYKPRGSGSYLVNALSRAAAVQVIRAMDLGYSTVGPVKTPEQVEAELGMDFIEDIEVPAPGQATPIESGT